MLRRNCVAFEASRTKSSSSCKYLSNSATTSRGLRRLPSDDSLSSQRAMVCINSRSLLMTLSMPGRNTFTATSRSTPWVFFNLAKCTWAIDALAMGVRSNWLKISSTGRPKARSIDATATSEGKGGTWSCSLASSSAMSLGSRSRRVDSTCPSLTKIGPKCSSA